MKFCGRPRTVPISDDLMPVIRKLLASDSEALFRISPKSLSLSFRRLTENLEIADLHFHDLRHTFATRLGDAGIDAGIDPFTIADLLGHADLKMTRRYTHSLDHNKRQAVAAATCHKSVTAEVIRLKKSG